MLPGCSHAQHPQAARMRAALAEAEQQRDKYEARALAAQVVISDPELVADVLAFYKCVVCWRGYGITVEWLGLAVSCDPLKSLLDAGWLAVALACACTAAVLLGGTNSQWRGLVPCHSPWSDSLPDSGVEKVMRWWYWWLIRRVSLLLSLRCVIAAGLLLRGCCRWWCLVVPP